MSGSVGSSLGRLAFTAIGYYFGGPIGGVIGGALGQMLFPQKLPDVEGPRLTDQGITNSTQGITIPIVHGTMPVAGNIIWDGGLQETRHREEQGGKGGPTQEVTTYTYARSFAVALCEGPIAGVRRIWANSKIIYDTRPQQEGESDEDHSDRIDASFDLEAMMTLYLGDEDQLPDPTIEADKGSGNVPAFRGLAYIVFEDYDVTELGGRPPTFQFEVYTQLGDPVELDYLVDPQWVSYPTTADDNDWVYQITPNAVSFGGLENAQFDRPNIPGSPSLFAPASTYALDGSEQLSSSTNTFSVAYPQAGTYSGLLDRITFDVLGYIQGSPMMIAIGTKSWYGTLGGIGTINQVIWYVGGTEQSPGGRTSSASGLDGYLSQLTGSGPNICKWYNNAIYLSFPGGSARNRLFRIPTSIFGEPQGYSGGQAPPSYVYDDSLYSGGGTVPRLLELAIDRGRTYVLVQDLDTSLFWVQEIDPETLDPIQAWSLVSSTGISGSSQSLLVHGNLVAVCAGNGGNRQLGIWELHDDLTTTRLVYDTTEFFDGQPGALAFTDDNLHRMKIRDRWIRLPNAINVGPVTLGDVVSHYCERTGMTTLDYDVSELTEVIDGFKVERQSTARGAIDPLRSFGWFDAVESGGQIKFPLRGKAAVATLDADDLAAQEGDAESPPLVTLERVEDVELPRIVRVHYLMPHAEYQVGEQKEQRLITDAVSAQDVDLPIAMTDEKAARIAQVLLAEAWIGRENYRTAASPRWLALEPSDAIVIPVEGENQRARIVSIQHGMPGLLQIELLRDDLIVYSPTAVGAAPGAPEPTLGRGGDTVMYIIDGPALIGSHNEAGVYIAARGKGRAWRGAGIYESIDSGSNYSRVLTVLGESTMGRLESALPSASAEVWDTTSTVVVSLDEGTLESRTEEAVLNGANAAFIGGPGRWEVIQFTTATLISAGRYELSGFLRGRRGTEHAIGESLATDAFALCDTCTRLPMTNAAINQARIFKAVTFGQQVEAATAYSFTPTGEALKPYSPVHAAVEQDPDTGDLVIGWIRRTRLSAEWLNDTDAVPLNEQYLQFSIDILDGTTVVRTVTATTNRFTYTAAQQVEDFGSEQSSVTVDIYQISAVLGRGYVGSSCAG